ncbi:MAG: hypothetical protein HY040_22885 [Planctomycetes bacterium]|nr:hypothetical protein [Planctomycetota bacterium]
MIRSASCAAIVMFLSAFMVNAAQDDFESELFQKFLKNNQHAGRKLASDVEKHLATASAATPEKAVTLLGTIKGLLLEDRAITKDDRDSLLRRVNDQLRLAQELLPEKKKEDVVLIPQSTIPATEDPAANKPKFRVAGGGTGPIFAPQITPVPVTSNISVTPVVSGDGMWVRVGVNASFSFPKLGPLTPAPIIAPNVLQGPGRNLTTIPSIGVTQRNFVSSALGQTNASINTTTMAPTGGTSILGGMSNMMSARNEFGVPGLRGVSYGSRLFRNVGYGSQGSILQFSVSPQVFSIMDQ